MHLTSGSSSILLCSDERREWTASWVRVILHIVAGQQPGLFLCQQSRGLGPNLSRGPIYSAHLGEPSLQH